MDQPRHFPISEVVPAAAMLALHAIAMALATRMQDGAGQQVWTGYHLTAALVELLTLSLVTRPERARWGTLLWAVPAADFVFTVALGAALRVL
jgi:hypothetical protein